MPSRKMSMSIVAVGVFMAVTSFVISRYWLDDSPVAPSDLPSRASSDVVVNANRAVSASSINGLDRIPVSSRPTSVKDTTSSDGRSRTMATDPLPDPLAALRKQAARTPWDGQDVVPTTPEDREYVIAIAIEGQGVTLAEVMAEQLGKNAWDRVPEDVAPMIRERISQAIESMKEAVLAHSLEVREATIAELRTADLSRPIRSQPSKHGIPGSLSVFAHRPQDKEKVRLVAHYYISYDKHDRVRAADDNRLQATRELNSLLDSL